MFLKDVTPIEPDNAATGTYVCARCAAPLFAADKKFNAGCGFPSFWQHLPHQVTLQPLHTYNKYRVQLQCSACGAHLGHLFHHPRTPTKLRYCLAETALLFNEDL